MSTERDQQLARALGSIRQLRSRLETVESLRTSPIAVVGLGCRLPDADDPARFWELVEAGADLITGTPEDRWDADAIFDPDNTGTGTATTRWGGFIDGIDRFDAGFFGISPREAELMDPQQRLFLEVAWEALEDGGQNVDDLAGSSTGVFVGVHSLSNDYQLGQVGDLHGLTHYSGTGSSHAVISGRLSYLLDLRGPSVAVDTACSSSLVAVHQAVQSLRAGESSAAIVGGVNLLVDPTFTVVASRMGMMSPTGRCHPFDAAGDGYVRSDACVAVVLKRLDDAVADGDPIRAVIRGSAVNQDGRSNGLTAPNGMAQEAVIRAALADARTDPNEIGLIETHGTGTPLGDPIEIGALAAIYRGAEPPGGVCHLGSAKANVGHTEGAAGIVGLLKAILAMEAGVVPPLVHFETLNPRIDLAGTPFVIPTDPVPWDHGAPRVAAVSSFGWSGTNAHLIVAEPPAPVTPDPVASPEDDVEAEPVGPPHLLTISARSAEARHQLAQRWAEHLAAADDDQLDDLCAAAVQRRAGHANRLAVVGTGRAGLIEALEAAAGGDEHPNANHAVAQPGLVTFICPGQGSQWDGMARDLLAGDPIFADAIRACEKAMAGHVGWSLTEIIETGCSGHHTIEDIDVVQPVLFAVSVALAAVWRAAGVEPDAVVGHSMGEVAAAHIAGALDLADATTVICARSALLRRIRGRGAMALVDLDEAATEAVIAAFGGALSVAVVNSRNQTVVSGDAAAIDRFLAEQAAADVFARRINVDVASHSAQVDELLRELREAVASIDPADAAIPLMSSVSGQIQPGPSLDADYWVGNLRQPVRFGDAIDQLVDAGHRHFVELSPHPVLLVPVAEALDHHGVGGSTVASLHRDETDGLGPLRGLAHLATTGATIDWSARYGPRRRPIALPAYPWQRESYWLPESGAGPIGAVSDDLLGWEVPLLDEGRRVWRHQLRADHPAVQAANESDVAAAALTLELLLRAADVDRSDPAILTSIRLHRLVPAGDGDSEIQVTRWSSPRGERVELSIDSPAGTVAAASARIATAEEAASITTDDEVDGASGPDPASVADAGSPLAASSRVEVIRRLLAKMVDRFGEDHTVLGTAPAWVPVAIERLVVGTGVAALARAAVRPHQPTDSIREASGTAIDADGVPALSAGGVRFRQAGPTTGDPATWLARVGWQPMDGSRAATVEARGTGDRHTGPWLVMSLGEPSSPTDGIAGELVAALGSAGAEARSVNNDPDQLAAQLSRDATVDADRPGPVAGVIAVVPEVKADRPVREQVDAMIAVVDQLRALVATISRSSADARIWLVTSDVHAVTDEDRAVGALAGMVWGFGRVVAEEAPEHWGGLVDLASPASGGLRPGDRTAVGAFLASAPADGTGERELAIRDGRIHVTRLTASEAPPAAGAPFGPDQAVLITGGFGAIGRHLARWLVAAGARHLILAGRTAVPDRSTWAALEPGSAANSRAEIVRQLEALGASVHVPSLDVTDPEAVAAFARAWTAEQRPPITTAIHTAAVLGGEMLGDLTAEDLQTQIHPKVTGALAIEAALPDLEHLVLFSSISGLLPMAGTAAYAAANAALDAMAVRRQASGRSGLSVNWGVWEGSNEVLAGDRRQGRTDGDLGYKDEAALLYEDYGITGFPTDQGLEILGRLLREPWRSQVLFSPVDWARFATARRGRVPPLTEELIAAVATVDAAEQVESDLATSLASLPPDLRPVRAEEEVRAILASVLKLAADRIDPRVPMGDLGLDSMMAVELRNRLEGRFGLQLSATVAWNHPTTVDLGTYLLGRFGDTLSGSVAMEHHPDSTVTSTSTASAIAAEVSELSDEDALAELMGAEGQSSS